MTVLAGGVGAARFLAGLQRVVAPESITAICNVGDDLEWLGLKVCPDIDTVIYTLAGMQGEFGWGIRDDTRVTLEALGALGGDVWFGVGDRDLATHLRRTQLLRDGHTLTDATAALVHAHGIPARVLPVTDDAHPTIVVTAAGDLPFQVYFVGRRATDEVLALRFPGAAAARPGAGVIEAIEAADVVVIAPSNPFVSIDPLLAVPGVREALVRTTAPRIAISPIVGGQAIKGPAADMLRSLGHDVSAVGVAKHYAGLIDCFVLDTIDAALADAVAAIGMRALVTDTMMTDLDRSEQLARTVIEAVQR